MAKGAAEPDRHDRMQNELIREDAEANERVRGKRGGGGKLSRSETVTVRLDPKLNYLCELAARAQRRTKSSFIEWAIENVLERVEVPVADALGAGTRSVSEMASTFWDIDEPDRLVNLAQNSPALLTHDEQVIWKIILNNGLFWHGKYDDDGDWVYSHRHASLLNITKHWDDIKMVAAGEMAATDLPKVAKKETSVPFDTDLDDDLPF